MIRLNIGSGNDRSVVHKGETIQTIGVDPYSKTSDIKANMWELPYDDNTVDEIYSFHALEHVSKKQVPITLKEWYRVLKKGGQILLRVPDLAWCCEHWLIHQHEGWALDIIFGNQNHDGEYHKTGFWKEYLERLIKDAGFIITFYEEIITHGQKTLAVTFAK